MMPVCAPECHPERKHYGRGLCQLCYTGQFKRTWDNLRRADCHPERPHHAKGLCASCYVVGRPGWKEQNNVGHRARTLKREYGLTEDDVHALLERQDGKCASCSRDITGVTIKKRGAVCPDLRVDHCHTTGIVRGLLCNKCNVGIGCFDDKPELLEKAAAYIRLSRETAE